MQPRPALRILTFLWGVAILVAALLAAYVTLLAIVFTLSDNPCALGDEPCNGTVPLRIFGVLFTLLGSGAVTGSLGAAVSYGAYAIRPEERKRRLANRFFVTASACAVGFALLIALVFVVGELGVDFTTDRPR
jgi:hypothetical protein